MGLVIIFLVEVVVVIVVVENVILGDLFPIRLISSSDVAYEGVVNVIVVPVVVVTVFIAFIIIDGEEVNLSFSYLKICLADSVGLEMKIFGMYVVAVVVVSCHPSIPTGKSISDAVVVVVVARVVVVVLLTEMLSTFSSFSFSLLSEKAFVICRTPPMPEDAMPTFFAIVPSNLIRCF